ncbi:hypothetical protein BCR34DRAFT_607027 [Clohesyomyces aquaticus]|uniref:BTB domain-containing protein n=1 Tax=Clohesyomyces aquaticus TaxID=1231657 RepID=A0A1Y1YJD9_9PLEO|nr:hypothetical protein BCR34DRAFT_607027 [Clohesyomyces aquaticus]
MAKRPATSPPRSNFLRPEPILNTSVPYPYLEPPSLPGKGPSPPHEPSSPAREAASPPREAPTMALLRPKFSLYKVAESNPAIARDENPTVFLKRAEKQLTQAQAVSNAIESTTPENIATMLRSMDLNLASENGQQKLRELTAALKQLSTAVGDGPSDKTTSNREQCEEKGERQYQSLTHQAETSERTLDDASRSLIMIIESDPQYLHGAHVRFESLASTLEMVDAVIANIEGREKETPPLRIVQPPWTRNGMLTSCGTAYLRPLDVSSQEGTTAEVFFTVHKPLLWITSQRFFALTTSKERNDIFEIDTDERTVEIVVDWLYYRQMSSRLSDEQLCRVALIAIEFQIPKLHNKVVVKLLDRSVPPPGYQERRLGRRGRRFPIFDASRTVVRKIYQATEKDAPMRLLVSYLLAREFPGGWSYGNDIQAWKHELADDVNSWQSKRSVRREEMLKDNPGATEQQAMDAFRDETFFMKEI